ARVAGERGQPSVTVKSPFDEISVIASAALPEFFSWIVFASLVAPTLTAPKSRLIGVTATPGPSPVPVSGTVRGLPAASSVMVSVPLRGTPLCGVNVSEIGQLPLGLVVDGHWHVAE